MKTTRLLTRDKFRDLVLARRGGRCVFCPSPATDAHHILERKLWPDGGYYLDNGAAVCHMHHMECERTNISVEDVRKACGIKHVVVPPCLDPSLMYDKWGNEVLPSGQRRKGPLFDDQGPQKMLKEGDWLGVFV